MDIDVWYSVWGGSVFLAFFMGEIMRTGVNRDICHTSGRKITRLNEIRQEVDE